MKTTDYITALLITELKFLSIYHALREAKQKPEKLRPTQNMAKNAT